MSIGGAFISFIHIKTAEQRTIQQYGDWCDNINDDDVVRSTIMNFNDHHSKNFQKKFIL